MERGPSNVLQYWSMRVSEESPRSSRKYHQRIRERRLELTAWGGCASSQHQTGEDSRRKTPPNSQSTGKS